MSSERGKTARKGSEIRLKLRKYIFILHTLQVQQMSLFLTKSDAILCTPKRCTPFKEDPCMEPKHAFAGLEQIALQSPYL